MAEAILRFNQKVVGRTKVTFCAVCGKESTHQKYTCGMYACVQAYQSRNRPDMSHMTIMQKRDWYQRMQYQKEEEIKIINKERIKELGITPERIRKYINEIEKQEINLEELKHDRK